MNVNSFGQTHGFDYHPTPPYGAEQPQAKVKKDLPAFETSIQNSTEKTWKDSQDLMGGPVRHPLEGLTPSEKAFYAKTKLQEVAMRSFGRYHDPSSNTK